MQLKPFHDQPQYAIEELGHTQSELAELLGSRSWASEAQANLVESLSIYDPELDREAMFRFDGDTGAAARAYLAGTKWQFGEVGSARALIEEAQPVSACRKA